MTYALDSNTISYFLRDEGNVRKNVELELAKNGNYYAIPPVVIYEVQRWLRDKPTKKVQEAASTFGMLLQAVVSKSEMPLEVFEKAADIYIELKQKGQLIGDADILIAAYCMVNNYTLVTRNTDDFKRIDGLKFTNWF